LPVVVVNPAQVRAFAHALGKRAKTDPIDAAMIAHFAETTKPQVRQLPDETTQMLADLVARRRQIVEMIVAESQRARRVTSERLKKSIARLRKRRWRRNCPIWTVRSAITGEARRPVQRRRICSPRCIVSAAKSVVRKSATKPSKQFGRFFRRLHSLRLFIRLPESAGSF
jgi:transposase